MKYSLETEFEIIEEKGYLISDGRLRVVTYKDEKDFNHYKEILKSAEYKEEDRGDYVIWKDDRIKGVKEWLQFGEEQGYLKIADLKKRKFADLKRKIERRSQEAEFEIIKEKGYLTAGERLKIVIYKDEKNFNYYEKVLKTVGYKEEDQRDYIIWSDNRIKEVKEWLQVGEEQGYFKITDLKERKLSDLKRRSQEAEFEIIREKGYLVSNGKLRIVTYKDERDFNHYKKILENVGYKKEDQGDYIIWKDNRIKGVEEWLQFGEEQGYLSIADLRKRKLIDFKRRSQEREFEIIREKGYLIAGERLRIVTYKDEENFDYYKEILEDVGYKKEDRGDYIIWSDNRIKEIKKWVQVGEELGYFKIADLEKRKLIDLKKGPQEAEFEIIGERGYLISGGGLRIVTCENEKNFDYYKGILEAAGYKREERKNYTIWSNNRISYLKKWLQVGEEQGYFKIADLKRRNSIDFNKFLGKFINR